MRYVWDKEQGMWVPWEQKINCGAYVIPDVQSFISPIDNKVVGSRSQLRDHNRRHGVVDKREFNGHKYERPRLPPVAPELAHVFKLKTNRY